MSPLSEYKSYPKWVFSLTYKNPLADSLQQLGGKRSAAGVVLLDEVLARNGLDDNTQDGPLYENTSHSETLDINVQRALQQEDLRVRELNKYYYRNLFDGKSNSNELDSYFASHQVWVPCFDLVSARKVIHESMLNGPNNNIDSVEKDNHVETHKTKLPTAGLITSSEFKDLSQKDMAGPVKDIFTGFTYSPTYYGRESIPLLYFHTSVSIDDKIYTFGGVRCLSRDNYLDVDIGNIKVKGPEYPFPLKEAVFNNPALVPNKKLYVLNTETSIVLTPELQGDIPPSTLCCATATVITHRYIFYYGGFELLSKLAPHDGTDGIHYVDRDIKVNDRAWVLDTVLNVFKEISLVNGADVPINFKRFGHSTVALGLKDLDMSRFFIANDNIDVLTKSSASLYVYEDNIAETVLDTTLVRGKRSLVLSLFVFGGYVYNTTARQFECVNDVWQIDLRVASTNIRGHLLFKSTATARTLPSEIMKPAPRGFHAAVLAENGAKTNTEDTYEATMRNKYMLVHGGTNLHSLYPDMWKYSFATHQWEQLKLFSHLFNPDCSPRRDLFETQFERANHQLILFDKYVLFNGGFSLRYVADDIKEAKQKLGVLLEHQMDSLPDALDIAEDLQQKLKKTFHRLIMLDLSSNTFVFLKYSQRLFSYINYREFLSNSELSDKVACAMEKSVEAEMLKLIQSEQGKTSPELLDKLKYLVRFIAHISDNLNVLGGTSCFANGKICSIGGSFLFSKSIIDKVMAVSPDKRLFYLWNRGFPVGLVVYMEIPIHAQGYVDPFLNGLNLLR